MHKFSIEASNRKDLRFFKRKFILRKSVEMAAYSFFDREKKMQKWAYWCILGICGKVVDSSLDEFYVRRKVVFTSGLEIKGVLYRDYQESEGPFSSVPYVETLQFAHGGPFPMRAKRWTRGRRNERTTFQKGVCKNLW